MANFVVYRIFNKRNGMFYVGSTANSLARKAEHFGSLRIRKHNNWKLQQAFNAFGESVFVFEILEDGFKDRDAMLVREYEIILSTKEKNYNIDLACPVFSNEKLGIFKPQKKKRKNKSFRKKQRANQSPIEQAERIVKSWMEATPKKKFSKHKRPKMHHPKLDSLIERKKRREANRMRIIE